jgi:outer membrane immunogenic protein
MATNRGDDPMKKLLIAGAMLASFAAIQSAGAADLALKAPPPPAPVYSWTGWYAGLNLGGSFGRAGDTTTFGPAGTVLSSTSSRLDGVIGGGQIGYNWQASNWLFGLEADIQGSSERGTATSTAGIAGFCGVIAVFPCTTTGTLVDQEKLPWFGTVRGRVGVLASPTWLFYATGGLAYGEIKSNETLTVAGGPFAGGVLANNFSTIRAGWTVGGGVEGVITGNWTAKLEYLYMDYGKINNTFAGVAPLFTPINLSTHVTDNVVRAGINYHFH